MSRITTALKTFFSLNPCCNGIYSMSGIELEGQDRKLGLS